MDRVERQGGQERGREREGEGGRGSSDKREADQ